MSIYFILFHNILYINCIREVWFHRLLLFAILIIMVIFTTIIFEIWWDWYCVCICSELIFSPRWPEVFYSRALLHLHHPGFCIIQGLYPGFASRVCIQGLHSLFFHEMSRRFITIVVYTTFTIATVSMHCLPLFFLCVSICDNSFYYAPIDACCLLPVKWCCGLMFLHMFCSTDIKFKIKHLIHAIHCWPVS